MTSKVIPLTPDVRVPQTPEIMRLPPTPFSGVPMTPGVFSGVRMTPGVFSGVPMTPGVFLEVPMTPGVSFGAPMTPGVSFGAPMTPGVSKLFPVPRTSPVHTQVMQSLVRTPTRVHPAFIYKNMIYVLQLMSV